PRVPATHVQDAHSVHVPETGVPTMFRKLALALGASAVIGAAALTPTTASAHWHGHHGHWHGGGYGVGIGLVAPATVIASECYVVKKVVDTPAGLRVRRITVCN
ncbi:MAG: hypothetical protein WA707_18865, partial [Pseudolabrys sp.]